MRESQGERSVYANECDLFVDLLDLVLGVMHSTVRPPGPNPSQQDIETQTDSVQSSRSRWLSGCFDANADGRRCSAQRWRVGLSGGEPSHRVDRSRSPQPAKRNGGRTSASERSRGRTFNALPFCRCDGSKSRFMTSDMGFSSFLCAPCAAASFGAASSATLELIV
jgi:hypothetical protein